MVGIHFPWLSQRNMGLTVGNSGGLMGQGQIDGRPKSVAPDTSVWTAQLWVTQQASSLLSLSFSCSGPTHRQRW